VPLSDFPAAPSYPWRLGTTSFVLPDGLAENVRALAGRVDAVQLLFFESQANTRLAHSLDVDLLAGLAADHDLAYAVHLPLDIRLGSSDRARRQQGLDEICRLLDEVAPLAPQAFDLHLLPEEGVTLAAWQDNLGQALEHLATRVGHWRHKIGIENIGYDFELVRQVVAAAGFGICVDFGHRLRYNHQTDFWALPDWRHIHLHAAKGAEDHRPFQADDRPFLTALGAKLAAREYGGIVTLELYELNGVRDSLAMLHEAWQPFKLGEK
jgi:hypothetical protein